MPWANHFLWIRLGAGVGHAVSLPGLAAVGLFVGYFAGMFGVGGGFLLTPVLIYVFGVPAPVAVGSALCQKCGTSISSFLKYRRLGRGEPRIDLVMLGGSLIGVDAGTRLLSYLSDLGKWRIGHGPEIPAVQIVLDALFIVLLSFTALYTFRDAWEARSRLVPRGDKTIPGPLVTRVRIPPFLDLPNVQLKQVSVPMLSYLGFVLGMASGLMGIGGGVLFLPILLYGIGLSVKNAAGTGVLLLFVTVAVGTIEQALRGYVSLSLA
ncbi:MAG: sulfite exporter TauE/SafE family protein, partial [Armatimonadota bacterium]|nr:sulfite exporter TauE/SafE family protein [Armatimonadota bacterium]